MDTSFTFSTTRTVQGLTVAPDGSFFVTYQNGAVLRYLRDGTQDSSFNSEGAPITAVAVQSDGKIVISGSFLSIQSVPYPCIARLNPDLSLDTSFAPALMITNPAVATNGPPPPPDPYPTNSISQILLQADGRILLSGLKNILAADGSSLPSIVRLNTNGTLDHLFAGVANQVSHMALQSDGRLLVAENTFSNLQSSGTLLRFNPDGSPDPSFTPCNTGLGFINTVFQQQDQKIFIAGYFYSVNGFSLLNAARLNSDGSVDTSFNSKINPIYTGVTTAVPDANGKVIIAGRFNMIGSPLTNLARLNPDGSPDPTYSSIGTDSYVWAIAFQPDGKLLVGGEFNKIDGQAHPGIARLYGNFNIGPGQFVFDSSQYETYESAGSISLTVRRIWGMQGVASVSYNTVDGTARGGVRYVPTNGVLSFADGQTAKTITIPLIDDNLIEDLQSFSVVLGSPAGGAQVGTPGTATIEVLDDDGPAALDSTFNVAANAFDSTIAAAIQQADGKLVLTGKFGQAGGFSRRGIARLNRDGTTDSTFNPGSGLAMPSLGYSGAVVAVQQDAKILVGGVFTNVNGITKDYLARLNTDGSVDTTFDDGSGPNNGSGIVGDFSGIAVQTNGQIIVGGGFNTYSGVNRFGLARLNSAGSVDSQYSPAGANELTPFGFQPDGKVVFASIWSPQIYRVNADGTMDNANFASANNIARIQSLPNGNTVVAGNFSNVSGQVRQCIARLLPNGSVDTTFVPDLSAFLGSSFPFIYNFAVQPDGKIVIALKAFCNPPGNYLARLNADGTLDTDFEPLIFSIPIGDNNTISTILIQDDGKIVVGGMFQTVSGLSRPYLVRLRGGSGTGTRQLVVNSVAPAESQSQVSLSVVPGKSFAVQVSSDFLTWTSVTTNISPISAFVFTDTQAAGCPHRYYRIKQLGP